MPQVTILFLGANPSDTTRLALGREVRDITRRLRSAAYGDSLAIVTEWAVRISDLQECLLRHRPAIVHFSGHGSGESKILVEDDRGRAAPVDAASIADLFGILSETIRCVVLNACYTAVQARSIVTHVDCVVGMTDAISDEGARSFSEAFYQALAFGESVQVAFQLGCNAIDLTSLSDGDVPCLLLRSGVDARTLRFNPCVSPDASRVPGNAMGHADAAARDATLTDSARRFADAVGGIMLVVVAILLGSIAFILLSQQGRSPREPTTPPMAGTQVAADGPAMARISGAVRTELSPRSSAVVEAPPAASASGTPQRRSAPIQPSPTSVAPIPTMIP